MAKNSDNPSPAGDHSGVGASGSLANPTILGEFELRGEIGRGGMGTVYAAWQQSLQRTVAVKVLARGVSGSSTAVVRFQREAQAAAKLHHPHIVPIFALGEAEGVYYYAMELIDGPGLNAIIGGIRNQQRTKLEDSDLAETVPLRRVDKPSIEAKEAVDSSPVDLGGLSSSGSPSQTPPSSSAAASCTHMEYPGGEPDLSNEFFRTVAEHMAAVADALDYAHENGVIHRDIKPHNLLVGSDNQMRISDFGLARLAEQPGVTMTGEMIGSPLYMSPEQIRSDPAKVDHRTDIYSLGATMYEWLTLHPPYPGETREQVISQIISSEPIPLRSHYAGIPVDLETICLQAIEKNLLHRYQSAGDLRDDLRRFLANQPIRIKRAGVTTRMGKLIGRHPIAAVATAAATVALALGWALVSTKSEVSTQIAAVEEATAAAEQAQQDTNILLDLFDVLPIEIGGPLKAVDAALGLREADAEENQSDPSDAGSVSFVGADSMAPGSPGQLARRSSGEFYQAIASQDSAEGSPEVENAPGLAGVLRSAKELRQKDPATAARTVGFYLGERPNDFEARQLSVALHAQIGEFPEMLEDADLLVRLEPNQPNAHTWRGIAHLLLGDAERCLSDLEQAAKLDGSAVWTSTIRGLALILDERWIEAIDAFDDVLSINPDLAVALLGRAGARASLGNSAGAITDLNQVLEMEPTNADALTLRGDHHVRLDDYESARRDYLKAMDIAGPSAQLLVRYGVALSRKRSALNPEETESPIPPDTSPTAVDPAKGSSDATILDWFFRQSQPDSAKHKPLRHIVLSLGG